MEIALSVALGILMAVFILVYLPQILYFGGIAILVIIGVGIVFLGLVWAYSKKPELIIVILLLIPFVVVSLLKEEIFAKLKHWLPSVNWDFLDSSEENEKARRRRLGYDD
jgi:hypothetical protein